MNSQAYASKNAQAPIILSPSEVTGIPWAVEAGFWRPSLKLPTPQRREISLRPSPTKLLQRVNLAAQDETVEPITLFLDPKAPEKIIAWARQLGVSHRVELLRTALQSKIREVTVGSADGSLPGQPGRVPFRVTPENLELFDIDALARLFRGSHLRLVVSGQALRKDRSLQNELLAQLTYFLTPVQLESLKKKIQLGKSLRVDNDLLPLFARSMIKKFINYRGPNCFHAALAFQSQGLTRGPYFKIKHEQGYHPAMVNYDELWRMLRSFFAEVDPQTQPLKYGDVIVFFDLPSPTTAVELDTIHYSWIRHAASYLFDDVVFSKGSKSPNTPYSVKTLDDEWKAWDRHASHLAVKVFRRVQHHITHQPPRTLVEWLE